MNRTSMTRISFPLIASLALLILLANLVLANHQAVAPEPVQPVLPGMGDENVAAVMETTPETASAWLFPAWYTLAQPPTASDAPAEEQPTEAGLVSTAQQPAEETQVFPSWFAQSMDENRPLPATSLVAINRVAGRTARPPSEAAGWVDTASNPDTHFVQAGSSDEEHHTIFPEAVIVSGPETILHGETVTFTIIAYNDENPTPGVVLVSSMPPGFTPPSHTFDVGNVAANEVITYYASFTADHLALSGQNVVTLTQDGYSPIVKYTAFTVNPGIPEASVVISGPEAINNCETVSYTISLTNSHSLTTTTGVVMTNTMPVGFTPQQYVYEIGDLAPGEATSRTAVFTASCSTVSGQNVTTLSQDGYADTITKHFNYVLNPGAITLRKTPATIDAAVGEVVTWTVEVENTGYGSVYDVLVTDTLGSGLEWVSGALQQSYAEILPGEKVAFEVAARIVACSGLENNAEAVWGCAVCQQQFADAGVDLLLRNPALNFTPPAIEIDYCTNSGNVSMPIQNTGSGVAKDVFIGVDFNALNISNLSAGAEYSTSQRGFILQQDIPAGETYTLTFTASFPNVCAAAGSGNLIYEPSYVDECGNLYSFPVKSGSWSRAGDTPGLSTQVSMPVEIQMGDIVTGSVGVNASNISGTVTLTDTIPAGWSIIDADGGVITSSGTITMIVWSNLSGNGTHTFHPVFQTSTASQSDSCTYCGYSVSHQVRATAVDCQDCKLSSSNSASTAIQCNIQVAGDKEVSPASDQTCSTYTYTNTYVFASDFNPSASWSAMVLTETMANVQQYLPGSLAARVLSGTETIPLTATSHIVEGTLIVTLEDVPALEVAGKTLVISYQLETSAASNSACSGASWYDWTYFDTDVSTDGVCGEDGILQEGVMVSSQAPNMSLAISGAPSIASSCGIYTITLNLARNSSIPAFDVVLDVYTDTYAVLDVLGFEGITPTQVTTDQDGYHFEYEDQFVSQTHASVDLRVQLRCTSSSAPLNARLFYDNNCTQDGSPDRTCSAGGNLASPTVLTPRLILTKFPEVIPASDDIVQWTLTAYNSGSGTAFGVTLTDTLGSGLQYFDSTITSTKGSAAGVLPITSSQQVTWADLTILPGEKYTIQYQAEVAGCSGLTNNYNGQIGCLGDVCLPGSPSTSRVQLPDTVLVNTNTPVSKIATCLTETITATVRNAGLLSVYDVVISETLPLHLSFVPGSMEYVIGEGTTPPPSGWQSGSDPDINAATLTWDKNNLAALERIYPAKTIWLRFAIAASCNFQSGAIQIQTAFRDTCQSKISLPSDFIISATPPQLSHQKVGRNLTKGSPWSTLVFAEPGDQVLWRINLTNTSTTPAFNLMLTDTLPANLSVGSIFPLPDDQNGNTLAWDIGELATASWTALVTTTLAAEGCTVNDAYNQYQLSYGCDDGCRISANGSARLRSRPSFNSPVLSTLVSPPRLEQCGGLITLNITNNGAPAYNVWITDTLPGGFFYQETVAATTPADVSPTPGSANPVWGWNSLPDGETEITFRVNSGTSGSCATPASGANQVLLFYDDLCTTTAPYTSTASTPIQVVSPNLVISKTPLQQTANVGELVSWSLAITNTGDGVASNILITDVVGAGYSQWGASQGCSPAGCNIPTEDASPTITWSPAISLTPGQTWSALVTATVQAAGSHSNQLLVQGGCDSSCSYYAGSASAFVSLIDQFVKVPEVQTHTIGSQAVFTLYASLPGESTLYQGLILTDTLPAGLSYDASQLVANYDTDDTQGSIITDTPVISGNQVIWQLGDLPGAMEITALITATVRDIPSNQNGTQLTNTATLAYQDHGQDYAFSASAKVNLVEPRLEIDKTVTPNAHVQAGDILTYTFTLSNSGYSMAYDTWVTDTLPGGVDFQALVSCTQATTPVENGSLVVFGAWNLAAGDAIVCRYTARVDASIAIQGQYTNTLDADWTSLEGADAPQERIYDDRPGRDFDADQDTDTAVFSIDGLSFSKDDGGMQRATIGDVVTYTLHITSPLGTIRNLVITDTLPQGLIYNEDATFQGLSSTTPVVSSPNNGSTPVTIVFGAWEAVVASSPAQIRFTARVANVVANQEGQNRTNHASLQHDDASGTPQPVLNDSDSVLIVEPAIQIQKVIQDRPQPTDANDLITYTATLVHPGGVNSSPAYDVLFSDSLPSILALQTATITSSVSLASTPIDLSAGNTVTLTLAEMQPGGKVTITYQAILQNTVLPGEQIENIARSSWSSLPGEVSGERTGEDGPGGELNDYAANDSASFTSAQPVLTKSLVSTSEAHTSANAVAIGEIIRYSLVVKLPEGYAPEVVLRDRLPAGLRFLNDGTAKVGWICNGSADCITSSTLFGEGLVITGSAPLTPTFVLSDTVVSRNLITNDDGYGSGDDVYFKLGSLSNHDDDSDLEYIVLEFNALVENLSTPNIAGATHSNDFVLLVDGSQSGEASNSVTTTVHEPDILLGAQSKRVTPTTGDAGDTITYTLAFTASSAAYNTAAFEVVLTDTLDSYLSLVDLAYTDLPEAVETNHSSGNQVVVAFSQVNPGSQVMITVTARVNSDALAGLAIPNQFHLTYTSLPGGLGTTGNPTGSDTPGDSGEATGERNGSQSPSQNNYYRQSNQVFVNLDIPRIDKLDPSPTSYTIGELVEYDIRVTLPEGHTEGLVVRDLLPAGLQLITYTVDSSQFAGNLDSLTITQTSPSGELPGGTGEDLVLQFPTVVTTDNNQSSDNTFTIHLVTRMMNLLANQQGDTYANTANLSYNNPQSGVTTVTDPTVPATITLLEPNVTIQKSLLAPLPQDAGDQARYRLTLSNPVIAYSSTAYDIRVVDVLPANLDLDITSLVITVTSTVTNTSSDATNTVTVTVASIPVGGSVVIDFNATLLAAVQPGERLENTAAVTWSSLPGEVEGERTGEDGPGAEEVVLNNYAASDAVFFITREPVIDKLLPAITDYPIGDTITYTLLITLPEGTIRNLVITDTLPGGLAYHSLQVLSTTAEAGGLLLADFNGSLPEFTLAAAPNSGHDVILSFDDEVTVAADNDPDTNTFLVKLWVRLVNEVGNQQDVTLPNQASLAYTHPVDGTTILHTSPVSITVIEPRIEIHKQILGLSTIVDAGSVISYQIAYTNTGNSPAYEVLLIDPLPSEVDLAIDSLAITTTGVADNQSSDASNTITVTIDRIDPGEWVTLWFTATLNASVQPGQTIENLARLNWTSLAGEVTSERDGSDGPEGELNDYATQDAASFSVDSAVLVKALLGTSMEHTPGANLTIGEIITYSLTITLPEGSSPNLVITDSLPAGLAFITDTVVLDTSGLNGSMSGMTVTPSGRMGNSGEDVRISFASVTVADDDDPDNNSFSLTLQAVVVDESGNSGVIPPGQTVLVNTAALQIDDGSPVTSNSIEVTLVEPRMMITKTFTPGASEPHEPVTITLVVQNNGTSTAFDVNVADTLTDTLLTSPSAISSECGFSYSTQAGSGTTTVHYTGGTVDTGSSCTLKFSVNIGGSVQPGTVITNTAQVSQATTLPGDDPFERDEPQVWDSEPVEVTGPDLTIDKDDDQDTATPAEILVYRLTVNNVGKGRALGVTITETVPLSTTFASSSSSTGWSCADGSPAGTVCLLALPDMPASAQVLRYFAVQVQNPIPAEVTQITNTARVADNGYHGADPTPENNTDDDINTLQSGALGNTTWLDANGNGIQDTGESALDGVSVSLTWYGADGNPGGGDDVTYPSVLTAGGGLYSFSGLPVGNFQLTFTPPGGYAHTASNRGSDDSLDSDADPATGKTAVISLSAGQVDNDWDAGFYQPVTIGNYTWHDQNADGQQDTGEPGLDGVSVTLHGAGADGLFGTSDDTSSTQVTSNGGEYLFSNQSPGLYTLEFTPPSGYVFTYPLQGDASTDSDADRLTGKSGQFSLASGESDLTRDAGLFQPAALGDRVWYDLDNDGEQDGGEPGLVGIVITTTWAGANGLFGDGDDLVFTTTTTENGAYSYSNLPPGSFRVELNPDDLPGGMTPSYDLDGVSTAHQAAVTLTGGQIRTEVDFGYTGTGSLGDYTWNDANRNGIQDSGENGINNVTVQLRWAGQDGILDTADDLVLEQTSATHEMKDGTYSFNHLVAGSYRLTFTAPEGYVFSPANQGSDDEQDSDPDPLTGIVAVELAAGQHNPHLDAGFSNLATVGDRVWLDLNADGVQALSEPGLGGVIVELYTSEHTLVFSTTTDSTGLYSFTQVLAGEYTVRFIQPEGYHFSPPDSTSTDDQHDSDADSVSGQTPTFSIQAGQSNLSLDCGFYQFVSLGNLVWIDANGNGIQDVGELPLAGVVVKLYDSEGSLLHQMTTLADGVYSFTHLLPATYSLEFIPPAGYAFTFQKVGADGEVDSDVDPVNGTITGLTLQSGDQRLDLDAGLALADFGDLPDDNYASTLPEDGPRHLLGNLWLGDAVSSESNGVGGDPFAQSDTYDDGVSIEGFWQPGNVVTLTVIVNGGNGYLVGWFDWDNDRDFSQPAERVVFSEALQPGSNTLTLTVPSAAGYLTSQELYARFRLYPNLPDTPLPTGLVANGEVEDYHWTFGPTAIRLASLSSREDVLPAAMLSLVMVVLWVGVLCARRKKYPSGDE